MLLFGHPYIKSESFYSITNIEEIKKTPSNATLLIEWSEKNLGLIKHINDNNLSYAIVVTNIKEAIFAENLNAKYILTTKELSASIANIATEYLFDAKILTQIESDVQIEVEALKSVDGVIFSKIKEHII
ncbi:MAG: hypothetical protein GQ570_10750 [Helicobacteraceae bacterium]|nr:hypothetical protein [Helicobacteraceae bacterium]